MAIEINIVYGEGGRKLYISSDIETFYKRFHFFLNTYGEACLRWIESKTKLGVLFCGFRVGSL